MNKIILGECYEVLKNFPKESFDLIYIDPPFNTGKVQKLGEYEYNDKFDSDQQYRNYIKVRIALARTLLKVSGSIFVHIDCREVHHVRFMLDEIFGEDNFQNEIIWAYDYGARNKNRWSRKHDNILWYTKDHRCYIYNYTKIDRIPYMAPVLVGKEKAERGKTPTDTWWQTIVPTQSKERTGYPTQKPIQILQRIIKVHTNPGDKVLDFFAGSGTTGEAAYLEGREFLLIDKNPQAFDIMHERFKEYKGIEFLSNCETNKTDFWFEIIRGRKL